MRTKRALLVQPGRFELDEAEIFPDSDQLLIKIASCGLCNMQDIITHTFSLDNIQEAFQTLEKKPADYIKGIVVP